MSPTAPLTLDQLRKAVDAGTINSQITDVATMASIGLALLTYFTDRQADTLAILRADLKSSDAPEIQRQAWRDIFLVLLTFVGFAALLPLVAPVVKEIDPLHRSAALPTLFLVLFFGYCGLLLLQLTIVFRRTSRLHDKTQRNRWYALVRKL